MQDQNQIASTIQKENNPQEKIEIPVKEDSNLINEIVPPNDAPLQPQLKSLKPRKGKLILILFVIGFILILLLALCIGGYFLLKDKDKDDDIDEDLTPTVTVEPTESEESEADEDNSEKYLVYYTDTDGDGFPDFVEEELDWDPLKNECLLELNCGDVPGITAPDTETNILLILDASSSMADKSGGVVKMDAAKEALKSYIDEVPEDFNVGFMVYGHKGEAGLAGKSESCVDPEILVPIQKVDKVLLKQKVDSFNATGWTPIAGSLKLAEIAFKGMEGDYNKIILVSDGEESCEGDPCSIAGALKASGINVVIDTVGFDVNQTAKDQLKCVAESTGGQYFYAETTEELRDYLEQQTAQDVARNKAIACLTVNEAHYGSCVSGRTAKAGVYLSGKQTSALLDGDNELADVYQEIKLMIFDKYKQKVDESSDVIDEEQGKYDD